MKTRISVLSGTLLLLLAVVFSAQAQQSAWPRTLPVEGGGTVTVYPMQVEEMSGDLVTFRAALALRESEAAEPVFGVGWFISKVEIDRSRGIVHPVNLMVSDTRFPPGTQDVKQDLTAVFAQQSQAWDLDFPMDDLVNALEVAEQEARAVEKLNNTPPAIIYKDHPALLVTFDGEPVLRAIENSNYQAVVNTSYPLIYNGSDYFLAAADDVWYRASQASGPYRFETQPPAEIVAMVETSGDTAAATEPAEKVTAENAPEIVVATTPTELIVTEGPAAFVPLVDDLLVLSNTTDDVFMHISTQEYYIVLAGRWYHSTSLNGPWTYSASDALPQAFAAIPGESDQGDARVYVAGTQEAHDAVLDAQIPQAAAVERGTVDMDVSYDGDPVFETVEGAEDLSYANNSGSTVLQADREYYLVEDGVWYVSSSPNGPWEVSAYRPEQVASISPRSPVYNVKYVYIYDSTPDVVYVGYTPGYTGSYVYGGTIVYGTGWYYQPWVSPYYYYPRYSTWGFNVSYNSWSGWNFGLSWGWGPFYAGFYSGGYWHYGRPWYNPRCNWWGPRGYRPRPAPYGHYAYGRGRYNRGGYGRGGYDKAGYGRGGRGGEGRGRAGYDSGNKYARDRNLYRDNAQRAKVARNGDYGRRGEKMVGGKSNLAATGKRGRYDSRTVSHSELRTKAAVRDARYDVKNGKTLANNRLTGKSARNAIGPTTRKASGSSRKQSGSRDRKSQFGYSAQPGAATDKTQSGKAGKTGRASAKSLTRDGKARNSVYSRTPATTSAKNLQTRKTVSRSSGQQSRQVTAKTSANSGKQVRAGTTKSQAYRGGKTRQASGPSRSQAKSASSARPAQVKRSGSTKQASAPTRSQTKSASPVWSSKASRQVSSGKRSNGSSSRMNKGNGKSRRKN